VIALNRPHVGAYDLENSEVVPALYWVSPRASTAASERLSNRSDVARCWQAHGRPAPPLKSASLGLQAISPLAAITGSAASARDHEPTGNETTPITRTTTAAIKTRFELRTPVTTPTDRAPRRGHGRGPGCAGPAAR